MRLFRKKKKKHTKIIDCPGCKDSRAEKDPISFYANCAGCKGTGKIEIIIKQNG